METEDSKKLVYRVHLNAKPCCFRQITKWQLKIQIPEPHSQTLSNGILDIHN